MRQLRGPVGKIIFYLNLTIILVLFVFPFAWMTFGSLKPGEKLMQVPYFRCSYEEDGYGIDQFNEIPSLLETEKEFSGATNEMIEYVGNFL